MKQVLIENSGAVTSYATMLVARGQGSTLIKVRVATHAKPGEMARLKNPDHNVLIEIGEHPDRDYVIHISATEWLERRGLGPSPPAVKPNQTW